MAVMDYYTPTYVSFGKGAADQAARRLLERGAKKVLVHFGSGSVRKSGLLDRVEAGLRASGIDFVL